MPPVVNLKTTVIPRSIMRATVLGDLMANFGAPPEMIHIAQQGYADGTITGLIVRGRDHTNYVREEAHLNFADLARNDSVSVDVSGGRSMIEAVSVKLAHAVSYSVNLMRRRGLYVEYAFPFARHVLADRALYESTLQRFGLRADMSASLYEPGTAMRRLFAVTPGRDSGISYSHASSRRIG